jgi:hypothetical protein
VTEPAAQSAPPELVAAQEAFGGRLNPPYIRVIGATVEGVPVALRLHSHGFIAVEPDVETPFRISHLEKVVAGRLGLATPVRSAPQPAPTVANDNDPEPKEMRGPPVTVDPFDPDLAGGLLSSTAQWVLDTSRVPVREFATMAAVALIAGLFGRRCVGPTGAGLNLYIILLAGSGFGKDRPREAVEEIATAIGARIIGPSNPTGDSAIERALRGKPCCVMPTDEIGAMLQAVNGKGASSWQMTTRRALLELYSRSRSSWDGKFHASSDRKKTDDPIQAPTLILLGTSTPSEFYAGLTEASFKDGFINRLTVTHPADRPERRKTEALPDVPSALVGALREASDQFPRGSGNMAGPNLRDATVKPHLVTVPWADASAERAWEDIEAWQLSVIDADEALQGIVGRAAEQTIKLATIRAISRDPSAPSVTIDDVGWGWAIVSLSLDAIQAGAERYMVGSPDEALRALLMEHITAAGSAGIPLSKLMERRGVRAAPRRDLGEALKRLVEAGRIEDVGTSQPGARGGRVGNRYRAVGVVRSG